MKIPLNINYLNEFRNIINYSIHNLYDNYGLKNIIEGSDDHESITANIKWNPKDLDDMLKKITDNSETIKITNENFNKIKKKFNKIQKV